MHMPLSPLLQPRVRLIQDAHCLSSPSHTQPVRFPRSLPLAKKRRFLVGSSDSDSDDGRRVVRSAKDKALEDLRSACDEIRVSPHLARP